MEKRWGILGRLLKWLTLERAAVLLPLLTLLGGSMLVLSVLVESSAAQHIAASPQGTVPPWPEDPPAEATTHPPTTTPVAATVAFEPTPSPVPTEPPNSGMNILLLGTDQRPERDATWRTDSIIIVALRPEAKQIGLFSIPRDLWVDIPNYGPGRINTVDYLGEYMYGPGGGPRALGDTLQQNLGITVDGYVRINFRGLERIIDALGGVTVDVDRYYDEWMDKDSPYVWHFQLTPGVQRLNGRLALGYVRSRKNSSDLDRCHRQQQVLLAMRDAALRPAVLPQIPGLVNALIDAVDTDLSLTDVPWFISVATQIDPSNYHTVVVDQSMVRDWITPEGAMVLLPDKARIREAWDQLTATP